MSVRKIFFFFLACSRYMLEKQRKNPSTYNIKPQEHCSQTGSFERLQCINDLCYCADEETGEVTGRVVPIKYFDKLPCCKFTALFTPILFFTPTGRFLSKYKYCQCITSTVNESSVICTVNL